MYKKALFLVAAILTVFGFTKLSMNVQAATPCIVTIFSKQYDITTLQADHSGGDVFTCGTDMSAVYQSRHGTNVNRMVSYLVITATPTPTPLPTSTPMPTPTPTQIPTPTPTRIPTVTPTPTPVPCQVTTAPSSQTLIVGGTSVVAANVTSGLGSSSITQMRFGSYDTAKATAITPDLAAPYSATVTAVAVGSTAVWATADLSDGRICQSITTTDTDITVVMPSPTPTPTSVPTPTPTPTVTIVPSPTPTSTPIPTRVPSPTPIPFPTTTLTPSPTPNCKLSSRIASCRKNKNKKEDDRDDHERDGKNVFLNVFEYFWQKYNKESEDD